MCYPMLNSEDVVECGFFIVQDTIMCFDLEGKAIHTLLSVSFDNSAAV